MADIPGSINKMNDIEIGVDAPLTEALMNKIGANINALIDLSGNFQVFTGNGTFTVPENITRLYVWGCGGGGGGGANGDFVAPPTTYPNQGGGGGMGSVPSLAPLFNLTPLSNISVTIGGGGAGGSGGPVGPPGGAGGNTVFGSFLTFWGAPGGLGSGSMASVGSNPTRPFPALGNGQISTNIFTAGGKGDALGLVGFGLIADRMGGGATPYAPGGAPGSGGFGPRGGGGGAGYGSGGEGGGTGGPGVSAAANSGAGGGGGNGGGNGGSGILVVFW
jgi:hypothetical protein